VRWMKITMPKAQADSGGYSQMQIAFDAAFMAAGGPRSAALFSNSLLASDCVFYFSPGAAAIFSAQLALMGAQACERPSPEGLISLVGNGDSFDLL
jgi:hypothetical protein